MTENNLGFNDKKIMCFGKASLNKYQVDKSGKIKLIEQYSDKDFYRATDFKILKHQDNKLGFCTVYPNQVHIIDIEKMKIYKRIHLDSKTQQENLQAEPFFFPNPNFDKTPYGNHPVENTPYIYLCNVMNIRIYDFENEKNVSTIYFNVDNPLVGIGHSSINS